MLYAYLANVKFSDPSPLVPLECFWKKRRYIHDSINPNPYITECTPSNTDIIHKMMKTDNIDNGIFLKALYKSLLILERFL